MKKCKCPPKKVIKEMKRGSREVIYCGRKYNQNAKIIKREGENICAKYKREDIPDECFEDLD